ncbi:glycosyltransferase [Leeia oryzae]|uniref:glycosyltransferase n=1 Tax=Leeia oryzae TaxID=356662 RepID=UPI00037CA2BA|nr:glycosyltransferase [Leeia oryzae]
MIIVKIIGGLGNQMMQYAFAHACAKRLGVPFKLDITAFESYKLWPYGLHNFEITAPIASLEEIEHAKSMGVITETSFRFDDSLVSAVKDGMYLDGYWADYRYSESVWGELKPVFTLMDPLTPEQQALAMNLSAPNAVALHVRRGDYVTNPNCFLLPQQYYRDAIKLVLDQQPDAVFYCFSDDPDWVEAHLDIPAPKVVVRGQGIDNGFVDMILMSKARHRIVANSTFSIWASRLADQDGLTIVPSQFFRKDDPWLLQVYGEVLQPCYPPQWRVVDVTGDGKKEAENTSTALLQIAGGDVRGRKLRIGVWGFYEEFYQNNYIFLNKNAPIGHELLKPFNQLYQYGQAHNLEFVTLDLVADLSTLDAVLFFDAPNMRSPLVSSVMQLDIKKYLCLLECELIKPDNWQQSLHELFTRIFTWHDGLVDNHRYIKVNYVTDLMPWIESAQSLTAPFEETARKGYLQKKLICNISGNKLVSHPFELYSKRIEVIRWFESHHPEHFDLYGMGWSASDYPSYKGKIDDKLEVLKGYRFSLCYENAKELPGYITEKIIDCFKAGVVPVYSGAPNIADWIPDNCFIDSGKFPDTDALYTYLISMTEEVHADYLENIRQFFLGGKAYPFSADAFINTITRTIVQDCLFPHERTDVSVVVPNYNHGNFVVSAITSALNQNVSVELLVLDNASTDDSWSQLQFFADYPQVRLIRNRWNIGVQHNWNHATWLATGRYVVMLSADDLLLPGHLEQAVKRLDENPASSLYYTPCLWINEHDQPLGTLNHPGHLESDYVGGRDEISDLLKFDSYITPSAAVIRRETLNRIGSMNLHLKGAIDWDLWIRIAEISPAFIFRKQPGVCYRQHSGNNSVDFYASTAPLEDHIRIVESIIDRKVAVKYLLKAKEEIIAHLDNRASSYPENQIQHLLSRINNIKDYLRKGAGPVISVIIPTKNRPGLLANALESLTYQTFKDFEVVIHNDGGCDIGGIVDFFSDQLQISYVRSSQSGGAAASRNRALKLAKGRIIAYLDDDDVYLDSHLEKLVDAYKGRSEKFIYTNCEYLIQERKEGRLIELGRERRYAGISYSRAQLLVSNFIPTPTWSHTKELIDTIGDFDESLEILEDWDFLLRASKVTEFYQVNATTVEVRSDRSRDDHTLRANADKLLAYHQKIYAKHPVENESILANRQSLINSLSNRQDVTPKNENSYQGWVNARQPNELAVQILAERMMLQWSKQYQFMIVMVVKQSQQNLLANTIDSFCQQLYSGWKLIVISDFEAPDESFINNEVLGWLTLETVEDENLLTQAFNGVLAEVPSDWVTILPVGTRLTSTALLKVGDRLLLNGGACVIYTDHDYVSDDGMIKDPVLKPAFNLDMLRSQDYIGSSIFFRTDSLAAVGGFASFPGARTYEACFRMLDNYGPQTIEHLPEPVMTFPENQPENSLRVAAMQLALEEHLHRNNISASIEEGYVTGTFLVQYHHSEQPFVSIIIPNKDKHEFLAPCIETLMKVTQYPAFEVIIVDNQSTDPDTLSYYEEIESRFANNVKVIQYDNPFNFSAQCNLGAESARGDFILFLNNDTEIVQANWLERMMQHAQRNDVGVVGARLVFPETVTIQHAGIVLGGKYPDEVFQFPYMNFPVDKDVSLNRTKVVQNYSAVTGACLLVRKSLYQQVGGMNEQNLAVLYGDVDLCLRIRQLHKSVVWTPFSTLVHHTGKTLNSNSDHEKHLMMVIQTRQEREYMLSHWLDIIANDPYYHRLLDKSECNGTIDCTHTPLWDDIPSARPRLQGMALVGGSGEYRVNMPFRTLERSALAEIVLSNMTSKARLPSITELARNAPDVFVVQNALADEFIRMLEMYKKYLPSVFRIQMLDDLLTEIPDASSFKRHFQKNWRDAKARLRKSLKFCDRLIVSTEPLRTFAEDMIDDIIVVPNMLERSVWGDLVSKRRAGKKPRVGWVGAQQHAGDLALMTDVVKATGHEVDWVFQGMCPDDIRPYVAEVNTEWLTYDKYPQGIAALNLDLAIAPLEINAFNEAKSNLRLLEYGALGWPVICTDIYPYQTNNAPVCRVPNDASAWIEAIRSHIADLDATAQKGDQLRQWVHDHYMIEDHAQEWLSALTRPAGK